MLATTFFVFLGVVYVWKSFSRRPIPQAVIQQAHPARLAVFVKLGADLKTRSAMGSRASRQRPVRKLNRFLTTRLVMGSVTKAPGMPT